MKKVIIKLMGGLGNQMFQYSIGYKIANILDFDIVFDTNFLEDRTTNVIHRDFDLHLFPKIKNPTDNSPNQQINKFVINESNIFEILPFVKKGSFDQDIYLDGFFQQYKFVDDALKNIFTFSEYENHDCLKIDKESNLDENLMISIRRTDYVTRQSTNKFHGFLGLDYFNSAIKKLPFIPKKIFVFSDDEEWCRDNFKDRNMFIVDGKLSGKKFIDKLQMMSKFSNMIIPNSTFSWWAAWLSEKNGTLKNIYAPGPNLWFAGDHNKSRGLIPNNWKTLERKDLSQ